MFTTRHALVSDRGLHHADNEDRAFADPDRGLFLISDGMAEAKSSQLAVDLLPTLLAQAVPPDADLTRPETAARVKQAVAAASRRVRDARRKDMEMVGATLVLALVRGGQALLAHLGDSRIYRCRAGGLERLTTDHSGLMRMVELGWITEEEAARARGNMGPTRFLGVMDEAVADVRVEALAAGDRLLLCSDGLTEMLSDAEIEAVLRQGLDVDTTCRQLVDAANGAGGRDNITVILVEATAPS
jgi:protein phosphatase